MPQREEYEEFFKAADADNSGTLTLEELQNTLKQHGYRPRQIKDMFRAMDTSGDNEVSLDEFMVAMGQQPPSVHDEATMRGVFQSFDKNGDGKIDRSELAEVFKEMDRHLKKSELKRMMEMLDKDKSGTVDYEEFVDFFFGKT